MLFDSFHHCAADKKLKSSRSENQTSEAGKCGGVSNSPRPFLTKAQPAGRCDVNGGKGKCSSSQLLDNANDTYEAPSALSPTTKRSPPNNALWAVEEQYESLDGVWNEKSCDKNNGENETEMGSYLASNDVLLKRDENYEQPVALEKNLNDFLYGNDKEWTMSDPVYEESKPSQLSGPSAAECQSRSKSCNDYENSEADHQESNTSYINSRLPLDNNFQVIKKIRIINIQTFKFFWVKRERRGNLGIFQGQRNFEMNTFELQKIKNWKTFWNNNFAHMYLNLRNLR